MSLFFSVQAAFSPRCSPISSPTKPPGSPNNLNFQSSTSLSSFVNKALNLTNTPVPKPLTATSTPHYTALDTPKIFSIRPHGSSRPVVGIHRHISSSPPVPCNHDTVRHVTSEGHVNPAAVSHHSTDTTPIGSRLDRDVERGSGDFNHTRPSRSLFSAFRCMSGLVSNAFSFHRLILIAAILCFRFSTPLHCYLFCYIIVCCMRSPSFTSPILSINWNRFCLSNVWWGTSETYALIVNFLNTHISLRLSDISFSMEQLQSRVCSVLLLTFLYHP